MTTKTATILVRTEPEIKESADRILAQIGLTTSGAMNVFLHQVVQDGGLPFRPHLSSPVVPDMDKLSQEEINTLLKEGMEEAKNGETIPFEDAIAELEDRYAVRL